MKVAWRPEYCLPLPEGHRFPMEKYRWLPELLLREGTLTADDVFSPGEIERKHLLRVHLPSYVDQLEQLTLSPAEIRKIGFPLSKELVQRENFIVEGTRLCALHALETGIALNVAGGTHHAYADHGEGFCVYNDQAVAARFLLEECGLDRILVVDLDVHQGNGTAHLFQDEDRVFTFSMHGEKNYPSHKESSDLDIEWPDGCTGDKYLTELSERISALVNSFEPEFVFYQCGVDVLDSDKLGRLSLTLEECKERDRIVLEKCKQNHLPVVCTMGGGYSHDLSVILEAHANTFRLARQIFH